MKNKIILYCGMITLFCVHSIFAQTSATLTVSMETDAAGGVLCGSSPQLPDCNGVKKGSFPLTLTSSTGGITIEFLNSDGHTYGDTVNFSYGVDNNGKISGTCSVSTTSHRNPATCVLDKNMTLTINYYTK